MTIKELAPWIAIAVTLILSILVPLFTQMANNRFQLKMKKTEIQEKINNRKISAYEDFFQNVGGCVMHGDKDVLIRAGASVQKLYIYLPTDEWGSLDKLYDLMKNYEWEEAKIHMSNISKWIAEDINS
jgi:hypothetical protein